MKYTVIVLFMCLVGFKPSTSDRRISTKLNRVHIDPPSVEALSPKGLRVSLPHIDGMQLFAFHAKINSPIRRTESGNIARDITHPVNGYWTFEDCEIELQIGDVINYWIFVEVNGMGYRVDSLSKIIKERVSPDRDQLHYSASGSFIPSTSSDKGCTPANAQHSTDCNCDLSDLKTITSQLNITLMQLNNLNNKLIPMKLQIESLTELLQDLFRDQNIGTQLLLVGEKPPGTNAVEAIRLLITEKLQLVDLENKIQQAHSTEDGIYFEMSSPVDKKRILYRAGQRLEHSGYKIVDPVFYGQSKHPQPYITAAMVRMGGLDYEIASNENREGYRVTSTSENPYSDRNWSTSTVRTSSTSTRKPTPQSGSSRKNLVFLNTSKSSETQYVAEKEENEDRSTFSVNRYRTDSRTTTDRPIPYNSNSRQRQQSSHQFQSVETSNERHYG